MDFKGWWRSRDGKRCDPLTVRDAFSRFVLAVHLCRPTLAAVREVFERLFARHGVPKAIQCDNGEPFVSVRSPGGISQLSAWWMALGVRLVRSRPGCPQDNGAHERMHADIAAERQAHPAETREAQQRELDRWRQEFNQVRPHEALGGKTPADVYKPTERRKPIVRPFEYPSGVVRVRMRASGEFAWCGIRYFLSTSLRGMDIGIQPVDVLHVRAWFRELDLGLVAVAPAVSDDAYAQSPQTRRRSTSRVA